MQKKIGQIIKELRRKKGYTQEQLAKILKIDDTVLSKIENGKRELEAPLLQSLSDIFEVSADYILGRQEKNNNENLFFFDMEGLTDEEIEDIKNHIEFVKWKSSQEKGNRK